MRTLLPFAVPLLLSLPFVAGTLACGKTNDVPPSAAVPARPGGPTVASGAPDRTFAITTLYLGDVDRSLQPSTKAWREFGFDLDGRTTGKDGAGACRVEFPSADAGLSIINLEAWMDGDLGRDNAFGAGVVPLIQVLHNDVTSAVSARIKAGAMTYLVRVAGLDGTENQTGIGLSGDIAVGAPLDAAPSFARDQTWPARAGTKTVFSDAYVTAGQFVGTSSDALLLHLELGTDTTGKTFSAIELQVRRPVVSFGAPAADGALKGTIAGVVSLAELRAAADAWTPRATSCQYHDAETLTHGLGDMLLDPASASPSAACDAVSVGIAFDAVEIAASGAPVDAGAPSPGPDPCVDAGTDSADGG